MGRKILFITTDQQRHDALGCTGGRVARTPVADAWAREGLNYRRAYNQNTVCMPARSTMLTGQYVRTLHLQGAVPCRRADAPAHAVAPGAQRRHRAGRDRAAGRPGRPGTDLLRHRRRRTAGVDGGGAAADQRGRQPRARAVRVGQPVPQPRHAHADHRAPRRLAADALRAEHRWPAHRARAHARRLRHHAVRRPLRRQRGRAVPPQGRSLQWRNLWDDPAHRGIKSDLIADLYDHLPAGRADKLLVDAPA